LVWYVVRQCASRLGLENPAAHELRRTCAELSHLNGGEIEQIQFLLGHASVLTTERSLEYKQNLEGTGERQVWMSVLQNIRFVLRSDIANRQAERAGSPDDASLTSGSSARHSHHRWGLHKVS
jgi:hypothetical protein